MALGPHQAAILARALGLARSGGTAPPGLLLVGARGSGKRAISRALADAISAEFVLVSMSDRQEAVREILIGGPTQTGLSGLLGTDQPTVLYLDHFHATPAGAIQQLIQQAVSARKYTTPNGTRYNLSPNLVLVAGLCEPAPDAVLTATSPFCTVFRRVDVSIPTEETELRSVASEMLQRIAPGSTLGPDLSEIVREAVCGAEGLYSLERWLRVSANATTTPGAVTIDLLRTARDLDIEYHLNRIVYRGRRPTLAAFRRWQNQFPAALHPVLIDVVRHIASRYYISDLQCWDLLDQLLLDAKIQSGEKIAFCKWQATGKSAPRVMNDLKNRCRFKPQPDFDATLPIGARLSALKATYQTFVFADDFIGSGETICKLWEGSQGSVLNLLDANLGNRVILLALACLANGEQRVRTSLARLSRRYSQRIRLCIGRQFTDSDRCFADTSSIIPNSETRAQLRLFCEQKFPTDYRFGFEDSQSLVVFPHTVPNNSIALLWYEQNGWEPLFPGSGRLEE